MQVIKLSESSRHWMERNQCMAWWRRLAWCTYDKRPQQHQFAGTVAVHSSVPYHISENLQLMGTSWLSNYYWGC